MKSLAGGSEKRKRKIARTMIPAAPETALSIVTKLKETSEVMIYACVLYMNLRKRLRLLLRLFFSWTPNSIQNRLEKPIFALV